MFQPFPSRVPVIGHGKVMGNLVREFDGSALPKSSWSINPRHEIFQIGRGGQDAGVWGEAAIGPGDRGYRGWGNGIRAYRNAATALPTRDRLVDVPVHDADAMHSRACPNARQRKTDACLPHGPDSIVDGRFAVRSSPTGGHKHALLCVSSRAIDMNLNRFFPPLAGRPSPRERDCSPSVLMPSMLPTTRLPQQAQSAGKALPTISRRTSAAHPPRQANARRLLSIGASFMEPPHTGCRCDDVEHDDRLQSSTLPNH